MEAVINPTLIEKETIKGNKLIENPKAIKNTSVDVVEDESDEDPF